ncbi:glycoside hydrolase domain-containing protein [Oceanobacillus sp. AG]
MNKEIAVINHYGLRVFPIYQDGGWYASYFNAAQGEKDAIINHRNEQSI